MAAGEKSQTTFALLTLFLVMKKIALQNILNLFAFLFVNKHLAQKILLTSLLIKLLIMTFNKEMRHPIKKHP